MITKGQLNAIKTLTDAESLLIQFRSEDKASHDRAKQIEAEIRTLRKELQGLKRQINNGISEEDILLKIGILHDQENATNNNGGGQTGGGNPNNNPNANNP